MLLRGKENKKEKGILLPVSALPSKHGIGNLGTEAYSFIDFLVATGQNYWQILPLVPVGKGDSPYSSISCFAGEILYIDLDMLVADGYLKKRDINFNTTQKNIDYKWVKKQKTACLKKAAANFNTDDKEFIEFLKKSKFWLEDFALFMAIKDSKCGLSFLKWEDGLKYRLPKDLEEFSQSHKEEILFYKITQYWFYKQYNRLRNYAKANNLKIIGDIPFYVSLESADVWANSEIFKLGRDMTPVKIAGVPPDVFSSTGQLWENPIYNWEYLKNNDYVWWRQRLIHNAAMYDAIRIDHFRAFADYYAVPAGSKDARFGNWEKGPGMAFWNSVMPYIKNTQIIAEDLGGENSKIVQDLITATCFPNMKVLQFAFDSDLNDPFLPRNFGYNCVCYTGTHDNDTTYGWYKNLSVKERIMFEKLVPRRKVNSPVLALIAYGMKSKAKIVIIPFADYLQLDSDNRLNVPSRPNGNWEWRFEKKDINEDLIKTVLKVSKRKG